MIRWYILDNNHNPIPSSAVESSNWMENNPTRKQIGYGKLKDINGDYVRVSTVFLGLDHGMPWDKDKTPVLWETMIFGGEHDQYQDRYTSYKDALEGHQKTITLITKE